MNQRLESQDRLVRQLSAPTRERLAAYDVVFDTQLGSLGPEEVRTLAASESDRGLIENHIARQAARGELAAAALPLSLGVVHQESRPTQGRSFVVRKYEAKTKWSEVTDDPGPLVRRFDTAPDMPTCQRYGSCAAHALGTALYLRDSNCCPKKAPSRRFLYAMSSCIGKYGSNEGRSFRHMEKTVLQHGYLTETECPTGHDDFDDRETYSAKQLNQARRRRCAGTVWFESNRTRLNAALDLTHGRATGQAEPLLVAVRVYETWARCFYSGVIRRHGPNDRLLGAHAVVLIGFLRFPHCPEKTWAVVSNSWGPEFGSHNPLGIPGLGLVSVDYLGSILCHGAMHVARTHEELERLREAFAARPLPVSIWSRAARDVAVAGGALCQRALPPSEAPLLVLALLALILPGILRPLLAFGVSLALLWRCLKALPGGEDKNRHRHGRGGATTPKVG